MTRRQFLAMVAFLTLTPLLFGFGSHAKSVQSSEPKVVLLVIDGPRKSEFWGDPDKTFIPHIANNLAPLGVVWENFRCNGPTYTNAGHAALTTGHYQEINNNGKELPQNPGLFQRWLKKTGMPKEKAWIVASKNKLWILGDTTHEDWKGQYLPAMWVGSKGGGPESGYGEDADTVEAAKRILKKEKPHLMLINLKHPDSAGHGGDFEDFKEKTRQSDAYAWDLYQHLQTLKAYRDNTTFIVTNDHGRHLDGVQDGFQSHGDDCEGCRQIFCLIIGPGFEAGKVVSDPPREQIDVAATAAALLELDLENSEGQVMVEGMKAAAVAK